MLQFGSLHRTLSQDRVVQKYLFNLHYWERSNWAYPASAACIGSDMQNLVGPD